MPMLGGKTVFDRAKKTGYMLGPQHQMGPAFDDQAAPDATMNADDPADPDGGEDEGDPPNLRDSSDRPNSCADCTQFVAGQGDSAGTCSKYGDASVTANETCDGFEGKTDDDEHDDDEHATGAEMLGSEGHST